MGGFPFSLFVSVSIRGKRSRGILDQAKERQMDGTFDVSLREKWSDSNTRDMENHVLEFGFKEEDHHKDTPLTKKTFVLPLCRDLHQ